MGAIDETRRCIQDFLAPVLREIRTRLAALETTTKIRFDTMDETTKARFNALEESTKTRFGAQDRVMTSQHSAVMSALNGLTNYAALAEPLTRLENKRGQQAH